MKRELQQIASDRRRREAIARMREVLAKYSDHQERQREACHAVPASFDGQAALRRQVPASCGSGSAGLGSSTCMATTAGAMHRRVR
jgi:hypothetical protein